MMKKIETIAALRSEKTRLKLHLKATELSIASDIENLKESIKPINLIFNKVGSTMGRKDNGLVNFPINAGIDLIVNKLLLRNYGFFTKLIVPFLAKNLANNYYGDHKSAIVNWVGEKVSNVIEKGKERFFKKNHSNKETLY